MEPSTLVAVFGTTALAALFALFAVLSRKDRTEDRARAYLAGFTYVLSDDPDAAIAELSRAAELSSQTLDTYFALGALFRRKGDLERAIRLHQNILLRPGLSPEVKRFAQLQLALDYRRSGLRGKAGESFEKVLAEEPTHREVLLRYRQLLEESQEWARAAELQATLVKLDGTGHGVLAHLLAAHARSLTKDAPAEAAAVAQRAVELAEDSADAQLALGQALLASGEGEKAGAPLERAVTLEPELAPRAVSLMRAALSPQEIQRVLRSRSETGADEDAPFALALALWHKEAGEVDRAIAELRRAVERRPWLWEARRELGALLLAQDRSEELRADYQEILGTLGQAAMAFRCDACRQKLPEHVFRCPSCESWDTVVREAPTVVRDTPVPDVRG